MESLVREDRGTFGEENQERKEPGVTVSRLEKREPCATASRLEKREPCVAASEGGERESGVTASIGEEREPGVTASRRGERETGATFSSMDGALCDGFGGREEESKGYDLRGCYHNGQGSGPEIEGSHLDAF